jgi:hypothetical protein
MEVPTIHGNESSVCETEGKRNLAYLNHKSYHSIVICCLVKMEELGMQLSDGAFA